MIDDATARAAWCRTWDGTAAALADIRSATGAGEPLDDGRLTWMGWLVEVGSSVYMSADGWMWVWTADEAADRGVPA